MDPIARRIAARFAAAQGKTAGADEKSKVHDRTWEWTKKAMDELHSIAEMANKASKNVEMLADKVEMRDVEKRAREGMSRIAHIFGK